MGIDALVLSGGSSRRLGRSKTIEPVGGRPLLACVTDALSGVDRIVVVGSADGASRADAVVRERPAGGGPVAAIAAGLDEVRSPVVLTLAGDLPFLTAETLRVLTDALDGGHPDDLHVVVALDDRGRDQFLLAAWRTETLRAAVLRAAPVTGARLGGLIADLRVARVVLPGEPPPWWDCDTAADLAQARAWALSSQ